MVKLSSNGTADTLGMELPERTDSTARHRKFKVRPVGKGGMSKVTSGHESASQGVAADTRPVIV